jgi:hypothetical protein
VRIINNSANSIKHFAYVIFGRAHEKIWRKITVLNNGLKDKSLKVVVGIHSTNPIMPINQQEIGSLKDYALVFHGKIFSKELNDYLLNNIKRIRKRYPDLLIILSTYDMNSNEHSCFIELGVEVVYNKDVGELPTPYPKSICQQIETVHSGLTLAGSQSKKYSIKIRVDQNIIAEDLIRKCIAMQTLFPNKINNCSRIFTTSYSSYAHRPLGVSDMFMFGETSDLLKYWCKTRPDDYLFEIRRFQIKYSAPEWNNFLIPETWLAARYLENLGVSLEDPGRITAYAWCNFFGIIDASSLGLSWFKTDDWLLTNKLTREWFSLDFTSGMVELYFIDWMSNYYFSDNTDLKTVIFPGA